MPKRDAALPGRQWLAKQGRSGFPGLDQDGPRSRPRAFVESGKRDDVATRSTPHGADAGFVPCHGNPNSEVDWFLVVGRWPKTRRPTAHDLQLLPALCHYWIRKI